MNILTTLLFQSVFILTCQSQAGTPDFDKYVKGILEDSSNRWKEYPKPPALTSDVSEGLFRELGEDSTKYYFEQLSVSNMRPGWGYTKSLAYFERRGLIYTTLAVTAHWNPDTRVSALHSLNNIIKIRLLSDSTKEQQEQSKKDNINTTKFLIHLLKSNPLFIPGSENATIHSLYITNIVSMLDLLNNNNIPPGRSRLGAIRYYTDSLNIVN